MAKYELVAVKRRFIPDWLFAMFSWVIVYQPFRFVFTRSCSVREDD